MRGQLTFDKWVKDMDLVFAYVEAILEIDKIQESNLDNRRKVRQNNKLADRIRKIASEIEWKYPEMKAAFYQLFFMKMQAFVFGRHII